MTCGPRGHSAANARPRTPGEDAIDRTRGTDWIWQPLAGRLLLGWGLAITLLVLCPGLDQWVIVLTVGSIRFVVWAIGLPITISGSQLSLGTTNVRIVGECTSLLPTLIFAAAVAAYPATARWRIAGIAGGAFVLWTYNLARVFVLMGILAWRSAYFDFAHLYLWQTFSFLVVAGLFHSWLRLTPQRSRAASFAG